MGNKLKFLLAGLIVVALIVVIAFVAIYSQVNISSYLEKPDTIVQTDVIHETNYVYGLLKEKSSSQPNSFIIEVGGETKTIFYNEETVFAIITNPNVTKKSEFIEKLTAKDFMSKVKLYDSINLNCGLTEPCMARLVEFYDV